jgi:ABC-type multidrug transport system fused ATPase/permease subunit
MVNITNNTNTTGFECSENMQYFHPVSYAFWWVTTLLLFLLLLVVAVLGYYLRNFHSDYVVLQSKTNSRRSSLSLTRKLMVHSVKPFSSFALVYFSICRILWLLNPHVNSTTFAGKLWSNGPPHRPIVSVLLYTPQVLVLLALTLLITLWRRVTNNAQNIRRRAQSIRTETRVVLACAIYLCFLALPVAFVSSWVPAMTLVSNGLFGLYVVSAWALAFNYIYRLSKLVETLSSSKAKEAVQRIERIIIVLTFGCTMLLSAIGYNTVAMDRCKLQNDAEMNSRLLLYIYLVHYGEATGCLAIGAAIFPRKNNLGRRRSGNGTRQNSQISTTSTDAAELEADTYEREGSVLGAESSVEGQSSIETIPMDQSTAKYVTS